MEVNARNRKATDSATTDRLLDVQGVQISIVDEQDMTPLAKDEAREAFNTGEDFSVEPSTGSLQPSRNSTSRSRAKKNRKALHRTANQIVNPPLRPAKDILSRIRHDPSLDEAEYVIGYLDRHEPEVQEMDVAIWKGGGDVTDEEWIPQHRIQYFRRKGDEEDRKVWDRASRLDRVFGSGVLGAVEPCSSNATFIAETM